MTVLFDGVRRMRQTSSIQRFVSHRWVTVLVSLIFAIGVAFWISSMITLMAGGSPSAVTNAIVSGSIGSIESIAVTLTYTAILLTVAIGTVIAGRAGLLNIGQEGQLTIGALLAASIGLKIDAPPALMIPLILVSSVFGGALWAGIAVLLKYWRNVHEAISSLLLSFVAIQLTSLAVNRTWLLQEGHVAQGANGVGTPISLNPQSEPIPVVYRLPNIANGTSYRISVSIVIACVLAIGVAIVFGRSELGVKLKMVGLNAKASRAFGVSPTRLGSFAFMISGGFAGLAGGLLLLSDKYRLQAGFAGNFGWSGLLVALVAGFRPLVAIGVALLFGALRAGGGVLASTGVSTSIVDVIQALLVCAALVPGAVLLALSRKQASQVVVDETQVIADDF